MKIDIYKSISTGSKYLSVPFGTEISKKRFPPDLDKDLLKLSPFKTEMDIQPGDHRVALDSDDIIKQINEKGFAEHSATITVEIHTGPRTP